ncbi:aminopeptidase [Pseudoxanthomonas suwonensis]|uniref:aminopeptidase n=1 Tax=Pseudoxanthomonas suwonensis TaxID=314722 RepID=UPI0009E5A5E0|nr:aminopeptidase [Pseudoxanthomonas suwonensis]
MKRALLAAVVAATVCSLAACQRPAEQTATAPPAAGGEVAAGAAQAGTPSVDLQALAHRVVTQSAGVKEGDAVLITGRHQDAELMEDLAVEVARVGGYPMIEYGSDRLARRLFFDVPEKYDAREDALLAKLVDTFDVVISLGNGTSENLFEGADPKRVAARSRANEAIGQAIYKNGVRMVELGNNMYPTAWRAERFGMDQDELARMFWDGLSMDYTELQARGEQVRATLAAGNVVHVTHPNGTDLTFRIQGRKVGVSDGIISEEDVRQGGSAVSVYLPAGEVYTTPVPGSAEGRLVDTGGSFRGKNIDNLTLTIDDGKVVAIEGTGPGYADLKAVYDAIDDERKNEFAFFNLGINPNVRLGEGSTAGSWMPAGAVTVGTGSNAWAGGDNHSGGGRTVFLPGSTVTLDDKVIVENGELKLQ